MSVSSSRSSRFSISWISAARIAKLRISLAAHLESPGSLLLKNSRSFSAAFFVDSFSKFKPWLKSSSRRRSSSSLNTGCRSHLVSDALEIPLLLAAFVIDVSCSKAGIARNCFVVRAFDLFIICIEKPQKGSSFSGSWSGAILDLRP